VNDAISPESRMRAVGGTTTRPLLTFGKIKVLSMEDIASTAARDYLLKGLMSPAEMSVWWGAPKCGKSFLMLHIAYAIAQGRKVLDRRVKACSVLFVAAEGEAVLAARLKAIRDKHGDAPKFHLIAQPVDLLHPYGDLDSVLKAARHPRIGAKLIVLDTLNRLMAGGDENGPEDMGKFIANIGTLRCDSGAHVAVLHHGTKNSTGSTPRGHGSLIGAADLVVEVVNMGDGSRTATVTQAKDDPDGGAMGFRLRVVDLGTDQDGDPITTCVVDELDWMPEAGTRLTPAERKARQFLADLIAADGKPLPVGSGFPIGLHGIHEDRWRDECESRRLSTADQRDSRTNAFRRAFGGLQNKGVIAARNGLVWLATASEPGITVRPSGATGPPATEVPAHSARFAKP
jgi:hypothetical protein